jgi:hypothetical protein
MRWVGNVEKRRGACRVLVGKPERKNAHGRPRCRWEDNIKMDLKDVEWGRGMDWIDLTQETYRWLAAVNTIMTLGVP